MILVSAVLVPAQCAVRLSGIAVSSG